MLVGWDQTLYIQRQCHQPTVHAISIYKLIINMVPLSIKQLYQYTSVQYVSIQYTAMCIIVLICNIYSTVRYTVINIVNHSPVCVCVCEQICRMIWHILIIQYQLLIFLMKTIYLLLLLQFVM